MAASPSALDPDAEVSLFLELALLGKSQRNHPQGDPQSLLDAMPHARGCATGFANFARQYLPFEELAEALER
jgi:hypothetical protein